MPDGGRSYMDDFNNQLQAMLFRNTNHTEERPVVPSKSDEPQTISPDTPAREVVLYQTDDGNVNVSVIYYDETFWLTQKAMAELLVLMFQLYLSTFKIYMKMVNYSKIQLFPKWKQFELKEHAR